MRKRQDLNQLLLLLYHQLFFSRLAWRIICKKVQGRSRKIWFKKGAGSHSANLLPAQGEDWIHLPYSQIVDWLCRPSAEWHPTAVGECASKRHCAFTMAPFVRPAHHCRWNTPACSESADFPVAREGIHGWRSCWLSVSARCLSKHTDPRH